MYTDNYLKMSDYAHIYFTATSTIDPETGLSSAISFPAIPEKYRKYLDFTGPFGYMMNYLHELGYIVPVKYLFNTFYPIDLDKYEILFKKTGYPMTFEEVQHFEVRFLNLLSYLHELGTKNGITFLVNAKPAK